MSDTIDREKYAVISRGLLDQLRIQVEQVKREAWLHASFLDDRNQLSVGQAAEIASCLRALYWFGVENYVKIEEPNDEALHKIGFFRRAEGVYRFLTPTFEPHTLEVGYFLHWKCPVAGCPGRLVYFGEFFPTNPASYQHCCTHCGLIADIQDKRFPKLKLRG